MTAPRPDMPAVVAESPLRPSFLALLRAEWHRFRARRLGHRAGDAMARAGRLLAARDAHRLAAQRLDPAAAAPSDSLAAVERRACRPAGEARAGPPA